MTNKEKYKALVGGKKYSEMTDDEQIFCMRYETDKYLPLIDRLREDGVADYIISAYLQDLYEDYLVCDDMCIANLAGISDEDYDKGFDYTVDTNPLIEY